MHVLLSLTYLTLNPNELQRQQELSVKQPVLDYSKACWYKMHPSENSMLDFKYFGLLKTSIHETTSYNNAE